MVELSFWIVVVDSTCSCTPSPIRSSSSITNNGGTLNRTSTKLSTLVLKDIWFKCYKLKISQQNNQTTKIFFLLFYLTRKEIDLMVLPTFENRCFKTFRYNFPAKMQPFDWLLRCQDGLKMKKKFLRFEILTIIVISKSLTWIHAWLPNILIGKN